MKYKTALFDLDGTIIDSSQGITSAVAYALDKHGFKYEGKHSLKHFIGPPLREEFMKYCGIDSEQGAVMVSSYREYYADKGIFECSLYDGVKELLINMKNEGITVLLATSKPEVFAKRILEHLHISEYFDFVGGAKMDNTRTDKCEVISYVFDSCGIEIDKNKALMIGDSTHDIEGARKFGLGGIAVSYGFGETDALKKSNPLAICSSPSEILEVFKRL